MSLRRRLLLVRQICTGALVFSILSVLAGMAAFLIAGIQVGVVFAFIALCSFLVLGLVLTISAHKVRRWRNLSPEEWLKLQTSSAWGGTLGAYLNMLSWTELGEDSV